MAELSGEFQLVTRATDVLLQVRHKRHGKFLILIELQLRYDVNMPRRLAAYAALAREKYKLNVYVVVIYLLEPEPEVVVEHQFDAKFLGQTAHQDFEVLPIWEFDAAEALALGNPAILPFVPLMRGGDQIETLQACTERIRQEPAAEELEVLLAAFASFVVSTETIRQLLRWDMKILRESPLFKELFKDYEQGLAQGRQEGREEGSEEGRETSLFTLRHFLAHRFGVSPDHFNERLQNLRLATIKQLIMLALDTPTLADFENALTQIELNNEDDDE